MKSITKLSTASIIFKIQQLTISNSSVINKSLFNYSFANRSFVKNIIKEQVFSKQSLNNNFRQYSTSDSSEQGSEILVDDNNNTIPYQSIIKLYPNKFSSWTKEQTCSLLCTEEKNGGVGLTIQNVKPLYDAGFDGTSLHVIASSITMFGLKDSIIWCSNCFPNNIPKPIISTIVVWVDSLLKTRLYHKWSIDQIREQLKLANLDENYVNSTMFKYGMFNIEIMLTSIKSELCLTNQNDSIIQWIQKMKQPIQIIGLDWKFITLKYCGIEALDAFSIKMEKFGESSWIVSARGEKQRIFSNMKEMEHVCDIFIKIENSTIRGRPSVEILGQAHTGKTMTAQYILPNLLAHAINQNRMKENKPKLTMAPTFYIKFDGKLDPITTIYNGLKKLRAAIQVGEKEFTHPSYMVQEMIDNYSKFTNTFPNVHIFIVLDQVQLLNPYDLDLIRYFVKSRNYFNVNFILTGSTQGCFLSVMDKAMKKGLEYQEGCVTYSIPIDNTQDLINDTFKFHQQEPFNNDEILLIRSIFGGVNCATLSQIIESMKQNGNDFIQAIELIINEIFSLFDRDIPPFFKDTKLSPTMINLLLNGIFTETPNDTFYTEHFYYFVKIEYSVDTFQFSFKDKLLQSYLRFRLKDSVDGQLSFKLLDSDSEIENIRYYILMQPVFGFGERIKQYEKKRKFQRNRNKIQTFLTTNNVISNLPDSDIDILYNLLTQQLNATKKTRRANSPKPILSRLQKLEQIFVVTCHLHSKDVKIIFDNMLKYWFKNIEEDFYLFLNSISKECTNLFR